MTTCLTLILAGLVIASNSAGAVAASPAVPAAHYVTLSGSPGMPELDPANDTIYVPIQCPQSYCPTNAPGRAVDIVDAATCNATSGSGCHVVATAPGDTPLGATVDPTTDTVYVMNSPSSGNSTIGLLDGRTCNATVTSGCRHVLATIALGVNAFIVAGAVGPRPRGRSMWRVQPRVSTWSTRDLQPGHERLHAAPRARQRQPRTRAARHRHGDEHRVRRRPGEPHRRVELLDHSVGDRRQHL